MSPSILSERYLNDYEIAKLFFSIKSVISKAAYINKGWNLLEYNWNVVLFWYKKHVSKFNASHKYLQTGKITISSSERKLGVQKIVFIK